MMKIVRYSKNSKRPPGPQEHPSMTKEEARGDAIPDLDDEAVLAAIEAVTIPGKGSETLDAIARFQKTVEEMAPAAPESLVLSKLEQILLPFWSDEVRAEANALLRSALFAATPNNAPRETVKNAQIAALDGIEIKFSGERLNQFDAQVFETVTHIARDQSLGTECRISAYSIMKALDVENTMSSSRAIESSLNRLFEAKLDIRWTGSRAKRLGRLISFFDKSPDGSFIIKLVPEMTKIFEEDVTYLPTKLLNAVRRSPLASWAVRFFLSHRNPYPITFSRLLELSGSAEKNPRKFKLNAKLALARIADAHEKLAGIDADYKRKEGEIGRAHV